VAPPRSASSMVIHHPGAGAAPTSSVGDDDFHWDDAAEAELQAIEAAYASAKRRRLPDWTSPSPSTAPATAKALFPADTAKARFPADLRRRGCSRPPPSKGM